MVGASMCFEPWRRRFALTYPLQASFGLAASRVRYAPALNRLVFGCAQSVQISLAILVQECPRAVVKLWGWGDLCVYDSGKLAERALSVLSSVAVLWCAYVLAVFTRPLPS